MRKGKQGYFMSESEQDAINGATLMQFQKARHRLGTLKIKATKIAGELEQLAGQLKSSPETLTYDMVVLVKANKEIDEVLQDIKKAWGEVQTLRAQVQSIGIGYLIKD